VPAVAAILEPCTLARTIDRPTNPNVVKLPDPESMNGKSPAADVTGNFMEGVEAESAGRANLEDADPEAVWRSNESDRTIGLTGRRGGARGQEPSSAAVSY
jgi:hypothetical protein